MIRRNYSTLYPNKELSFHEIDEEIAKLEFQIESSDKKLDEAYIQLQNYSDNDGLDSEFIRLDFDIEYLRRQRDIIDNKLTAYSMIKEGYDFPIVSNHTFFVGKPVVEIILEEEEGIISEYEIDLWAERMEEQARRETDWLFW
jgi:hypothetical protein